MLRIQRKTFRRRIQMGVCLALATLMAIHFTLIALYLMPANAITVLHPEVTAYVKPFFNQNWHLFAPAPPTANRDTLIQVSLKHKAENDVKWTEWIDVVSKLRAKTWSNPFAAEVTRSRTIRGVFMQYQQVLAWTKETPNYATSASAQLATRMFNRLLVVLAENLFDKDEFDLEAVRAQVVVSEIPPISESQTPDYKPQFLGSYMFPWFPPDRPAGSTADRQLIAAR